MVWHCREIKEYISFNILLKPYQVLVKSTEEMRGGLIALQQIGKIIFENPAKHLRQK